MDNDLIDQNLPAVGRENAGDLIGPTARPKKKCLQLMITCQQMAELKFDAKIEGSLVANLVRVRLFGEQADLRGPRPPLRIRILGDALGHLGHNTKELKKVHIQLAQIGERLTQSERGLFMLDSSLRHFERTCGSITQTYTLIRNAIAGTLPSDRGQP